MPFFNWALLKSRTLHPDIGVPADDTQGLPYLSSFSLTHRQNYGLVAKTQSGTDSVTGFLFTSNMRYLLGSGEAKAIGPDIDGSNLFAVDSLNGHVFALTANGIINRPISISGNKLGWSGGGPVSGLPFNGSPPITFFLYSGSKYVGFGNGDGAVFCVFVPGGFVYFYQNYSGAQSLQACTFYNGLYTILYNSSGYGSQYGPISLSEAPEILPAFPSDLIIPYSFTESAILISQVNNDSYGYDGINDPTLTTSFIKLGLALNDTDIFGFDPVTGHLLSISSNIITVGGYAYYPVYVYNSLFTPSNPQQYARPVKNYTVNGHLNWRKQR